MAPVGDRVSVTLEIGLKTPGKTTNPIDVPQCLSVSPRASPLSLVDAGNYITKLSKAEHEAAEWQAAMEALILVATSGGPTMFARFGIMRALNRHVQRVFNPDGKEHHWGRRKLARDP